MWKRLSDYNNSHVVWYPLLPTDLIGVNIIGVNSSVPYDYDILNYIE